MVRAVTTRRLHRLTTAPMAGTKRSGGTASPEDRETTAKIAGATGFTRSHNGNGKARARTAASGPAGRRARIASTITARLLETVRDRTGYPIETLGLDLDMEADLGIDSIKRVEILGKLRDEFPGLKALSDSPEMMDAMARARTLGVIVDRMASLAEQRAAQPQGAVRKIRRVVDH